MSTKEMGISGIVYLSYEKPEVIEPDIYDEPIEFIINTSVPESKYCKECQEWKAFDCFYKSKQYKDGYQARCKLCRPIKNSPLPSHKTRSLRLQSFYMMTE